MEYTELVKKLRSECALPFATLQTMREAADAIEELQQIAAHYEETAKDYFKDVCYYLERMPKWIPVAERLPEEKVEVLISDNTFFGGPIVAVAYWERGKCEWRDDMSTAAKPKPTHWMPLPEPPKEETE